MSIINTKNLEEARKQIKKARKPIIVKAQEDNFNRKILEHGKFQILLSPETGTRKNSIKQLDSGLNHVLAKIAFKNNITIGIDLEEIKKLPKLEKAIRLSKIKQNIEICRKTRTRFAILGNKKEGLHLLLSLGASTEQTI
ncbi:MAG: hypothetical protein IIA87_05715 [Nanoarchaeota archaeon]|nr:hypothetical protein [Nanoarchaeota archaeon]